jgi:hypothetical protein
MHNSLETGSVSIIRCKGGKDATQLDPLWEVMSVITGLAPNRPTKKAPPLHLMTGTDPVSEMLHILYTPQTTDMITDC